MSITKASIVETISEKTGLPTPEIKDAVELLIETMKSTMASGEDVMISGFGKFQVKEKEPRKGRNPAIKGFQENMKKPLYFYV